MDHISARADEQQLPERDLEADGDPRHGDKEGQDKGEAQPARLEAFPAIKVYPHPDLEQGGEGDHRGDKDGKDHLAAPAERQLRAKQRQRRHQPRGESVGDQQQYIQQQHLTDSPFPNMP